MKKYTAISCFVVFAIFLCLANASWASSNRHAVPSDSVRTRKMMIVDRSKGRETSLQGQRMASSTFPVRLEVKGCALCVTSDYAQLLPIYTRGGSLYMAMRLNKGKNWLNGLPRGRYLINNQQISIP